MGVLLWPPNTMLHAKCGHLSNAINGYVRHNYWQTYNDGMNLKRLATAIAIGINGSKDYTINDCFDYTAAPETEITNEETTAMHNIFPTQL